VRDAVHRIVQEAATNVLRHAGTGARRGCGWPSGADAVEVEVRDAGGGRPGPPRASAGPGRGLAGMRERVTLLGGHVEAGRAEPRGWRVRAVLPR
jgi:signal transduction histidine kinase